MNVYGREDTMNILKQLRERSGYSQQELAEKIGVTRQTIIAYEAGRTPSAQSIKKLAQLFGISEGDLLNGRLPKEPSYDVLPAKVQKAAPQMRISIPQENINKFKEVFYISLTK